ncbi:hypothetical protein [Kitasatospora sp. NBC_00374]|uniref:hypothetical protein n=1 Tax=Kitasatospora sp. NBC_00374 TaxID=2975964 RepID=UPI00352CC2D3
MNEAYRHAKPIAALPGARAVLTAAGADPQAPGIIIGTGADTDLVDGLVALLAAHRVWDRFPADTN